MRFVFLTHSLVSDWNHGNAHFQRGVMRALQRLGHECLALEPHDSWSRRNLLAERPEAEAGFARDFPDLTARRYATPEDCAAALDGADVVIVHEWTDPAVVRHVGRMRARGARFRLLFHDTHHRAVSAGAEIGALDLSGYDAILAFGEALRARYLAAGWGRQVFTWHEAADDSLFRPQPGAVPTGDLVWVGNWGDGERAAELREFLIGPVARLGLRAEVWGVRYPPEALAALEGAGIAWRGSVANARVPAIFARHRVTVHVPRRPYVEALPGIPTIRVFEALACGIPLVSAPWDDAEGLFRPGLDFLTAADGAAMARQIRAVLSDRGLAAELAASGLSAIRARHTCRHRAVELLGIVGQLGVAREAAE